MSTKKSPAKQAGPRAKDLAPKKDAKGGYKLENVLVSSIKIDPLSTSGMKFNNLSVGGYK